MSNVEFDTNEEKLINLWSNLQIKMKFFQSNGEIKFFFVQKQGDENPNESSPSVLRQMGQMSIRQRSPFE